MKAEILILVITWLVLVAIQAMLPWLSRRNVLFGVVYARTSIWQRPEAVTLRRRYLVASLLGAVVIAVLAGGAGGYLGIVVSDPCLDSNCRYFSDSEP